MLYFQADGILYPIWRVRGPAEAGTLPCICWDIGKEEAFEIDVIMTAVQEERPGEIERANEDPSGYRPTMEEMKEWIEERS